MTEEIRHWRDIPAGNRFMQKLDARMLGQKGVVIRREVKLGKKGDYSQKARIGVNYDREFAVAKLANLLKPLILVGTPKHIILRLVAEAIERAPQA